MAEIEDIDKREELAKEQGMTLRALHFVSKRTKRRYARLRNKISNRQEKEYKELNNAK